MMRRLLLLLMLTSILAPKAWGAFTLDASSDNIQLADNAALTLPDADWTIYIRLKQTTNSTYDARALSWNPGGNNFFSIEFNASDGIMYLGGTDADGTDIGAGAGEYLESAGGTWPTDNAEHIIIVSRSGTTFTLYLDNVSVVTTTNADFDAIDAAASMFLGNRPTVDRGMIGSFYEFAKWDRALNAGERAALQGKQSAWCIPDKVVYVPFIADSVELVRAIALTLNSIAVGTVHAPLYYCGD